MADRGINLKSQIYVRHTFRLMKATSAVFGHIERLPFNKHSYEALRTLCDRRDHIHITI